jgi:hypothetical protein
MTEEHETTIRPERMELFNKIGDLLGDQDTEDVVFAICDHLAMAVAFVCESLEDVEGAFDALRIEMMKTVRENWDQSRRARHEAERMEEDHG